MLRTLAALTATPRSVMRALPDHFPDPSMARDGAPRSVSFSTLYGAYLLAGNAGGVPLAN
jgi:hypothetical protein